MALLAFLLFLIQSLLLVNNSIPLYAGIPASPSVNLGREEVLTWRAGSVTPLAVGGRGITNSFEGAGREDG